MANYFKETWLTLRAVGNLARQFFVRWFLPLHGDEPEAEEDGASSSGRRDAGARGEDSEESIGGYRGLLPDFFGDEEADDEPKAKPGARQGDADADSPHSDADAPHRDEAPPDEPASGLDAPDVDARQREQQQQQEQEQEDGRERS